MAIVTGNYGWLGKTAMPISRTSVDAKGFSGTSGKFGSAKSAADLGVVSNPIRSIAAAQGVQPAAADVRSIPTSQAAAFQVSTPQGLSAMSDLQSIFGQLLANSAKSTEQSQAFAREQMAFQQASNAKAMAFNAEQARLNREWQEYMSNTAHQREVADLKAAGLNPVLSAMGGTGATVGSGATASASSSAGAKGEVYDTNAAISGILSTVLSGEMALEAANINARTQEAVADKYTAMSQLVETMKLDFEKEYPSNVWRFVNGLVADIPNMESAGGAKSAVGKFAEWLAGKLFSR